MLSLFIICKIKDYFSKKSVSPLLFEKKELTLLKREPNTMVVINK